MAAGGAERVFSFLAQHLDKDKFESTLLITGKFADKAHDTGDVAVTYLEKDRVLHAIPGIFKYLSKNRPEVVLSSLNHLNAVMGLLSIAFRKTKFIIRPTNIQGTEGSGPMMRLLRFSFAQIDKVVCQSLDMSENFQEIYKTSPDKMNIIGNPITNSSTAISKELITQCRNLITVGRLKKVKGHARILSILGKLNTEFHYTIIGDGPEKENLLEQIRALGLESQITHIPYSNQVDRYLSENDLFLQGSYSEGFPNAALESCAMGTPVLAFNVPGGTREIIEHEKNGFLVETEEDFLQFLKETRQWNRKSIHDSVMSKFSSSVVIEQYQKLITSLLY